MSRPIVGSRRTRACAGGHKRSDTIGGPACLIKVIAAQIETFRRGLRKCVRANSLPTEARSLVIVTGHWCACSLSG